MNENLESGESGLPPLGGEEGPPPLTDLDDFELLDLAVSLHRGNRRYDEAERVDTVTDLVDIEESDLEPLLGTEVGDEIIRRRTDAVDKAREEQDRLKKEALESETLEQRAEREASEADQATRAQQELEDDVRKDVVAVNEKFAAMRAGRFQVSRRGTFPRLEPSEHEVAFNEIMAVLGPAEKLAGLKGVEFLDAWNAATPRDRQIAIQFFGTTPPVDLDVDGDGYREAVDAHARETADLGDWARGQLKAHKERTYR